MKKVLLIEDDTILRENTAELLELSNYKVTTAADGKIGISKAESEIPDIIVCDIMMPELDGVALCKQLKWRSLKDNPWVFAQSLVDSDRQPQL